MALLGVQDISLRYSGATILDQVGFQIEPGEKVCLIGRNGTGKSSLLKIIQGEMSPDGGLISRQQGVRSAYLPQEVPQDLHGRVADLVEQGLNHAQGRRTPQQEEDWWKSHQVDLVITRMSLDPEAEFQNLSAGMKRRVLLAQGLVSDPDLLLLDEPTNHLDIVSITWLEDFLSQFEKTLLFITHDRMFLRRLSNRILELDRGRLYDWACDYDTYLQRKQDALNAEASENARFDKKLAQEEVWIRQGIKARRTRNEGRVRALKQMREIRKQRRQIQGNVRMQIQEAERSGDLVMEVNDISFAYDNKPIVSNFSSIIMRGDKVGIIGPNGSGKTTLLHLLLGDLQPQQGFVHAGTKLEIAYFDQLRAQLDESKSVVENVGDGSDTVRVNGKPRHIYGYLQDFLFTPDRAKCPVGILSGGERNRLLLAKMFTKPSNVLVLDEPTNDLDMETLDLLEEMLIDFEGTLLIVSHDREFLNHVVTGTISLEGNGQVKEYVGGYDDWLRQRKVESAEAAAQREEKRKETSKPQPEKKRLTFREIKEREEQKRELESLPHRIEELEAEQQTIHDLMSQPAFYQQKPEEILKAQNRLKELEQILAETYRRWEQLEILLAGI